MNKAISVLKKIVKIVLWVILSFVLFFIFIVILIQIPAIQNKIVNYATSYVSNKTHTKVEINRISLSLMGSVSLQGLFMEDLNNDTLLYAGKLNVSIGLTSLLDNKIDVQNLELHDVYMNINRPFNDSLFNFNFLLTAFSDTAKPPKAEKETTAAWTFALNKLILKNIHLRFDDEYAGMNAAVDLKKLALSMNEIDIVKSVFSVEDLEIDSLQAHFLMLKPITASEKESESVLPIIRVGSIKINNSMLSYGDSINNMGVLALVKKLELKLGVLDLEKQNVEVNYVGLSKSKIQFNTEEAKDTSATIANDVAKENNWTVSAENIALHDNSFAYNVNNKPKNKGSFDPNHLAFKQISLSATDLYYSELETKILIKEFSATDNNTGIIAHVSGNIYGAINNLTGNNLIVKTGSQSILKSDFQITGLPDIQNTYFDFPNLRIITGKQDIKTMLGELIPQSIELPENVNLQIAFKGRVSHFQSNIVMNTNYGLLKMKAQIDENENFTSSIGISSFNLGYLLKDTILYGPVSLTAEANGKGFDMKKLSLTGKASISKLYLNKYTYHNLQLDGSLLGQKLQVKAISNDENANFDIEGMLNLDPNHERYKFNVNVGGVDLKKLHFTEEDLRVSLIAKADLQGDPINLLNGNVSISKLIIAKEEKKHVLDSPLYASINEPSISLQNMPDVHVGVIYKGTVSLSDMTSNLNFFFNQYFPFSDTSKQKNEVPPSNCNFQIQLRNHPELTQALLPELKEFEQGIIWGSFDSQKGDLQINATIKKITYGTNEISDFMMAVSSTPVALNYQLSSSDISNSQIKLDNFLIEGKISDETIFAGLSSIDDSLNKKIVLHALIAKDEANYKLMLDSGGFYLMNKRWGISPDNYILFGEKGFLIHHFLINNTESRIHIASVNNKFNDDINIEIKNFQLHDISQIIEKDSGLVKGYLDGNVLLKRVNDAYGIIAEAQIIDLFIREVPIGNLSLKAENPTSEKFDIDIKLAGKENNLTANGYFIADGSNNALNINVVIQALSMKTIEAFSMAQITEASGNITGDLLIHGAANAPEVIGKLVFNNIFMKPAILNTSIALSNETISFSTNKISFDSFTLTDAEQHSIVVDGTILMTNFADFVFALEVNATDFLLMNTTVADNEAYFGRMIIDSKIEINGPITLPVINAKVKLKRGSSFTFVVPEEKLSTNLREDVVTFEAPRLHAILNNDDSKEAQKSSITGIDLTAIIEIDKEATLCLLMDPSSSDSLVVRGEAALSFSMDRSGKMSLTGSYNLYEGSYMVSLESLVKREFDILPGSTIIWNGDVLDAEISINTKYTVRAAPYDLVAYQISNLSDTESGAYKQRFPFWVLLKLRGQIMEPEISFEIQLPPEDRGILGGVVNQKLNLLNEDLSALNKQVFALLILGRFIQENPLSSETSGAASVVRTTVGKYLSAQLNQLSSRVIPGVELNVDIQSYDDYQSGQAEGRTEVEIGIKKQLFNERISVQIGGTVDVEGEQTKQNSASDITGDVQVEYKLTKDGRFRLKGFRHNQYEGAIEGQLVETGVGVVFVRNFNKWKDIFKREIPENDTTDTNNQP